MSIKNKSYGNELLHSVLLAGMKDIDKICRENNINYFIYAGTLLGAIVHQGFIPWDDDVDIVMFRDDYEKFEKIIMEEYSDIYFVQTYKTDYYHPNNRIKIRVNHTKFITNSDYDEKLKHNGVFIDIALLYNVPDSKFLRIIQKNIILYLDIVIQIKLGIIKPQSWKTKLLIPFSKLNRVFLGECMDYIMINLGDSSSKDVGILCNTFLSPYTNKDGYTNDISPRYYFENPCNITFEDIELMGIRFWHEELIYKYGENYMLPYPEEKRITKHDFNQIIVDKSVKKRIGICEL